MSRNFRHEVSVIIPVYNQEMYLEQCLQSVMRQSEVDVEIVCINDGSTDRSGDILEEYSKRDKRIVVINQSNKGKGAARNAGINAASGEYIAFLDSDDFFLDSGALSMMVSAARRNGVKVVGSHLNIMRTNGKIEKAIKHIFSQISFDEKIFYYNDIQLQEGYTSFIYSTELILDYNLSFKDYIQNQDCPFQVQVMYYAQKIVFADTNLYCIRDREQKELRTFTEKSIADEIQGYLDIIEFASERRLSTLIAQSLGAIYITDRRAIKKCLSIALITKLVRVRDIVSRYYGSDKVYFDILQDMAAEIRNNSDHNSELNNELRQLLKSDNQFYIYGAGSAATYMMSYLSEQGILDRVKAVLVTSKKGNPSHVMGVSVFEYSNQGSIDYSIPIVVSISGTYCYQLAKGLIDDGFQNLIFLYAIDIGLLREKYIKRLKEHNSQIN